MVYTCNMKTLESTKDGKKMNVLCLVDQNNKRSVVVLDHFRNFKGIQLIVEYNIGNEDEVRIQEKEIIVLN